MANPGEIFHDSVFDSEVTFVYEDGDAVVIDDSVGEDGIREVRKEDWEHNVLVGRYEKVGETEREQIKMDELEQENYEEYVAMGEVEIEEDEKGIFDY